MFGIEHLTVEEISVWDHQIEILVEIQQALINTKKGSYFRTRDIHQVPNSFIEQLLKRELKGYCKEEVVTYNHGLSGIDDQNIHRQPYCNHIVIPCKRSKIYFCETHVLKNVLADSKYWYIASRVKRGQSTLGRATTCIVGGSNGCIPFDYNWTLKILTVERKCDIDYNILGLDQLDNDNNMGSYMGMNSDIPDHKIFILRDGELCKGVHVVNALNLWGDPSINRKVLYITIYISLYVNTWVISTDIVKFI